MPAILVVTPHPDDESFGPAGTIARYAAQGVPVDMLVFTRGQVGTRPEGIDSPEQLGRLREYETRAAARVLGVRDLTFLDYPMASSTRPVRTSWPRTSRTPSSVPPPTP